MFRGNLSFTQAPVVAYDFSCLFNTGKIPSFLIRNFPSFLKFFVKVNERAVVEIESLIKAGYEVQVVFWPPLPKTSHPLAEKLFFKHLKGATQVPAKIVWKDSHHQIRAGEPRYEAFFTNRLEVLPYFPSDFIRITIL